MNCFKLRPKKSRINKHFSTFVLNAVSPNAIHDVNPFLLFSDSIIA